MNCDFHGNDLSSTQAVPENCGQLCWNTAQCTHFTSTNGGTCFLKSGSVSKDDAYHLAGASCGIIRDEVVTTVTTRASCSR